MPNAPLAKPEAAPAADEAKNPGMVRKANPFHNSAVATRTKIESASCSGAAGMFAKAQTPNGVATAQPKASGANERQWMSFQMEGSKFRLAANSNMKIEGTISAG